LSETLDLAAVDGAVLDMDGVLWLDDLALPGMKELFALLARLDLPYVLATNNAGFSPADYARKLARMGVDVLPTRIVTSAVATATWLQGELPAGAAVYVVGSAAAREAVAGAGFELRDGADAPVAAVVAGIDFELTYAKVRDAAALIRSGARFVGTNGDLTYPTPEGLAPGAGVILAAIQAASGAAPTIVGKPEPPMFAAALRLLGTPAERTLMVGDRLDTDILGARRAGLRTVLVTTGVDAAREIEATGIRPDAVYSGLGELVAAWTSATVRRSGDGER